MADSIDHRFQLGALFGCAGGGHDEAAQAAGARLAVDHLDAPGMPGSHDPRCLGRGLARSRQAACQVDGDDVAARADERLKAGKEVPHRRLRGRGQPGDSRSRA